MYEELIERLREYPDREESAGGYVEIDWQDLLDAADAIESLDDQLAALQSENAERRAALSRVEAERDAAKPSAEVLEAIDELVEFARDRMSIGVWLGYVNVLNEWRGVQGAV